MHTSEIGLVGREPELARVLDAVEHTRAAGLSVVLVSGEAGIGKSRLLHELISRLEAAGNPVLASAADEQQRRIPYAALAAGVRSLPGPTGTRRAHLRDVAIAALDIVGADRSAPPGAWFAGACTAITRLLSALSDGRPAVLALDDIDLLDDDSIALLTLVLRRLSAAPLALVATIRSHPSGENAAAERLLERLEEHADVVRVDLGALSGDDVAAIAASVLGAPVAADLAREMHRRCDGNPFFATEIARSLLELKLVEVEDDRARLVVDPDAIRLTRHDALLRRVAPLTGKARVVANVVSVLRHVRLDQIGLIAHSSGLPETVVTSAFDDLVRAGIVTRSREGDYRFFHALVADALYDEIGPAERRHLHQLVADRLLDDRARGFTVDVLELAWHISESAEPGDEVAVTVLAEAAKLARASAPAWAASLCARALELLPDKSADRGGLLSLRCRALFRASRPADTIGPGMAALELLPSGHDRFRAATAVIGSMFLLDKLDDALAVTDDELARGCDAATLHAQRAVILAFAGRFNEARTAAEAAQAVPVRSPAEEVILHNQLAVLTSILYQHDLTIEHTNLALRASGTSPVLQLQALALGASTLALPGLVHDATWRLRRAEELLDKAGGHAFRADILLAQTTLDWLGGRWNSALERLGTAIAELEAGRSAMQVDALVAIALEIRAWRGELSLAARWAERPLPASHVMRGLHLTALVDYHSARGRPDEARRVIEELVPDPRTDAYGCVLLSRLIDLDVAAGRTDSAARTLELLAEIASPRFSPLSRIALRRSLGLVHRDPEWLRRAVTEAKANGLEFDCARAQLALGELDPGEQTALESCYVTFQRLGAHGLRRQAGRRLRELGAKVPRARSRRAGLLTETEDRIARLVQQGMRNRDIATALHYSPRTIEVYLSRIYAKLHVSSRLQLARALDTTPQG